MPLTARSSAGRRRKKPDEKLPEPPGESTSAQVMAPTRMKLRVRRRDAAGGGGAGGGAGGGGLPGEEEGRSRESRSSSRRKSSGKASTAAAAASSPPHSSPPTSSPPTSSASARAVVAAEDASPDSKCPICLDRFNNLAYLDRCLHRFCFPCIQEWSHNKAECPLCKQPFASILHSVRAEDDFKEYTLRPPPANSSVAATVAMVAAMASAARSNHQMRLMLRRHRTADGLETSTRRRRRERGGRGGGGGNRRTGVWEWYLDSPPLPLPSLPHHPAVSPVVAEDSGEGEDPDQQRTRGGADLAERGVIFEGLTGLGGARTHNDRATRRLMTRLATRQRLQRDGGTVRRLRERETVAFRRALYRSGVRVRGVAGGNQGPPCDITAESFRRNPVHLNKLRPWLRRELTVLYGAHGTLVDIVQRIIMAQLARHGLEDSPTIEDELRPFLLARTDHFLHELVNFARSPLSLENYDLQALYEPPAAALELDGISSASDSSSVIAISEGEEHEAGGGSEDVIQTGSCLSMTGWDDETPGPSYSTAEPSCSLASLSFSPAPQEAANQEGEKGEEECLIVGYKKPIAERTPELVQLSSDSEGEEKKEELPPLATTPPPPPPLPHIPTIPPSTSAAFQEEPDDQRKEKDGEAGGPCSRARSWSASSGRSSESVCTLSPGERREDGRRDWKQLGSETARERRKRRRRRKRTGPDRSGTLCNPNRSIYPAMMCHPAQSPSPFPSSVESSSPPDSSVEYRCSPLSSSCASSRSSSAFCFSPPLLSSPLARTPPVLSPGDAHHRDKPGGKRKYKSRHLDSNDKDPTWRPQSGRPEEKQRERRRKRGRDGGRRRDAQRRESDGLSRRNRDDRSPSVEIIYEGTILSDATQRPPDRKRRRKRHRKNRHSSSPVIITLDSDTSHDDDAHNKPGGGGGSSSSSPLSSQQTVDFSDLPPLPLVHSAGVGGALDEDIGDLPVDILDRGSDGSEAEPPGRSEAVGPVAVDNNSDHDVDVEHVEEGGSLVACGLQPTGDNKFIPMATDHRKRNSEVSTSDTRLLATILDDLRGIAAPKCDRPLTFDPSRSPDSRKKRFQDLHEARPKLSGRWAEPRVPDVTDLPPCRKTPPPLPPLQQMDFRVGGDGVDVPPLLRQASPVRAHHRNTPPPLKHKDAGSPHLSPAERLSPHASAERHFHPAADSRCAPEADAPNSALKKHLKSSLALRGVVAPDSRSPALTTGIKPASPVDSSSASANGSTHSDVSPHVGVMNSFHSSEEHSSCDVTEETSFSVRRSSAVHVDPVHSVDFHSAVSGWSKEKLPHNHSTSGADQTFRPSSCRVAPVSSSAGDFPAGSGVFSGVNSNDASPLLLSTVDSRNHSSPVRSLPVDLLRQIPDCTDPRSSCAAAERLTDTFSVVTRGDASLPVGFHSMNPSPASDGHFNHAASPTSRRKCLSDPPVESLSKHSTDSNHHNHFDPVDAHRDDGVTPPPHNQWNSNASADAHSDSFAL